MTTELQNARLGESEALQALADMEKENDALQNRLTATQAERAAVVLGLETRLAQAAAASVELTSMHRDEMKRARFVRRGGESNEEGRSFYVCINLEWFV